MEFILPHLPVHLDAFSPHLSEETMRYHYVKHHQKYIHELNRLIKGTVFESMTLEDIIRSADGAIYNNAAQAWNHTFYWYCLSPQGGGSADGVIGCQIASQFGSFEQFRVLFTAAATALFGSGWVWLVARSDGQLTIESMANAGNPITTEGVYPLLTCDVWEHAYYIDYRNDRRAYLEQGFWNLINWRYVESCFDRGMPQNLTKLMTQGGVSDDELSAFGYKLSA